MQEGVSQAPEKPLLIYDGDCNFCRRWIEQWRGVTGDRVDYITSQEIQAAGRFPEIPAEAYATSVQLVEPEGAVHAGAEAVFRALAYAPDRAWPLSLYQRFSWFARGTEAGYRLVARHRMFFSTLTRWLLPAQPAQYQLTRLLFLRLLGLVYCCAFLSLIGQVSGLVGPAGIQPVQEVLKEANPLHGFARWHQMPTLCWWLGASDASLQGQCAAGIGCALLLMCGFLPLVNLILLWVLYLSMTAAGGMFMAYQWENLLLEAGLMGIFWAPLSWTLRRGTKSSRIGLFLLWWLAFRLMFESGWVKLSSSDPSWRNLLALDFHYETQPLPTMFGYLAHQLPHVVQAVSIIVMLFIELAAPFLIFGPRRGRLLCAAVFAGLQLFIALTGNYGFFNLLTIVLCIPLLDDEAVRNFFGLRAPAVEISRRASALWRGFKLTLRAAFLVLVLFITGIQLLAMMQWLKTWSEPVRATYAFMYPLRSLNAYGLFGVMTTNRTEIVIQGSSDGKTWKAYEFKYKPGDPDRRPRFAGTHMPRLDWQMWFAALGDYSENEWLLNLSLRLLQGDKTVLKLLRINPFEEKAPRYIRAVSYEYRFTDVSTQMKTGHWWTRNEKGVYMPPVSLNSEH